MKSKLTAILHNTKIKKLNELKLYSIFIQQYKR